jgi:hypothetical protein
LWEEERYDLENSIGQISVGSAKRFELPVEQTLTEPCQSIVDGVPEAFVCQKINTREVEDLEVEERFFEEALFVRVHRHSVDSHSRIMTTAKLTHQVWSIWSCTPSMVEILKARRIPSRWQHPGRPGGE